MQQQRLRGLRANFTALTLILVSTTTSSVSAQLGGAGAGRDNPIQLLTEGSGHYRAQDYDKARAVFETLVRIEARNSTAHYYLGLCYAQIGEAKKSVKQLEEAIALGHPYPEKLEQDRELAPLCAKQPVLKQGVKAIARRAKDRLNGVLQPAVFDLVGSTRAGVDVSMTQFRGSPVAVVFLKERNDESTEAGYVLQGLTEEYSDLKVVGVVDCRGKSEFHRKRSLDAYAGLTGYTFPLMLSTPELRGKLRPFREHPAIVLLDREGKTRRIVEGKKPDYRIELKKALEAVATFGEKSAPDGKAGD